MDPPADALPSDARALLDARGPLEPRTAASVVVLACSALVSDVRPARIGLTPATETGHVEVRVVASAPPVSARESLLYVPPEGGEGPRALVWSLGATLYELCAGVAP